MIWHLLALGVPEDFPGSYPDGQAAVDAVRAVGGIIFCAHPNGYFSLHDILQLNGLTGIEVANTNCKFIGRESNETVWNELIAEGWLCPALGVDDMHTPCDFFGNWTVIAAENKEPETILRALANGSFYFMQHKGLCLPAWSGKMAFLKRIFRKSWKLLFTVFPDWILLQRPASPRQITNPN